jgi:putative peptidoglycan lipid II flippase
MLAKFAGAFKTVVAAGYFGARDDLDAYLAAFLIPAFLGDVFAGALAQSLMPALLEIRHTRGAAEEQRLASAILITAAGALTILAIAAALFSRPLLAIVASGFGPAKVDLTRSLLLVMLPILPISGINVALRTMLNSRERFFAAAATPTLTPIAGIGALVFFGRDFGIYALAAGSTVGVILEAGALCWAARLSGGLPPLRWEAFGPEIRRVWKDYTPLAATNLILSGSTIVDQAMAAMLGTGSLSALNYGTRLTGVLIATGPASLATSIFPRLSRLAAAGERTKLRRLIRDFGLVSLAITLPVTVTLIALSEPLVRVLFQRGAFTAADSMIVARVQAASLVQIPFSVLLMLSVRAVSAMRRNIVLIRMAALSLVVNFLLNLLFMRWAGVAGIALSTAGVQGVALAFLWLAAFRRPFGRGQNQCSANLRS